MKRLFVLFLIASFAGFVYGQSLVGVKNLSGAQSKFRVNAAIDDVNTNSTELAGTIAATAVDLDATSATSYFDMINSEWTSTAANTSGGSNGIYSIINPVYNFQNAYGLRARVDMRDAADSVCLNQTHAIDGIINLSEEDYWVDDNISVFSGAIHSAGITAGDIDSIGTLNLYHGVFPSSLTENFTVETNAMKIITFAGTHCDYGFNFENSGTTTAGIYLNNHASNSPATMTAGIKMKSAAGNMSFGIDMSEAGIDSVDIAFQNGAIIYNSDSDTLTFVEDNFSFQGVLYVEGVAPSDFAITDDMPTLSDYWAETLKEKKFPAMVNRDRRNVTSYISGLEEAAERNLRFIVKMEARLADLEMKLNE